VAEFVVELYVRREPGALLADEARAKAAAEDLTREGVPIRFAGSIHMPEDETGLFLYEATTEGDVRAAAARAGLAFERVVAAVSRSMPPSVAEGDPVG